MVGAAGAGSLLGHRRGTPSPNPPDLRYRSVLAFTVPKIKQPTYYKKQIIASGHISNSSKI